MRLLFTPPLAGRRPGLGWAGPPGPRRPGALGSARLGKPLGLRGRVAGGSRPAGRPPGGGAPGASPAWLPLAALRPLRPPGDLPRGFTRVHTSRVKRLEGAPVSPGCRPAGEEAQSSGLHSPGIPPLLGPGLRALGVISLASLPSSGARWLEAAARPGPGPARPTGKPAPAPVATDPNDLNIPARSSGGSRAGCAQGALVESLNF